MNDSPFFSIITVVLNGDKFLERSIKSVLNQYYENFELLIIDGKSTDNTLEIVRKFANDKRLKCTSESDSGIYDAMNKGIQKAKGEWIYFLGYDDFLIDNEVLQEFANAIKTDQPDFIYGKVIWGESNQIFGKSMTINDLKKGYICHQSIFVRKNTFSLTGYFDTKFKYNADAQFVIKCFQLENFKIKFLDRIVAYYHTDGVSSTNVDDNFVKYKYTFFHQLSLLEKIKKYYFLYKPNWFKPSRIFK